MGAQVKRLCTICARGGSKGVPNKNVRMIAGKPLIAHTISQAKNSELFESVAVNSDSMQILDIAHEYEVDFLINRPDELASDTSAKLPAIQFGVKFVEEQSGVTFDTIVDLDATAPLRTIKDIQGAVNLQESKGISNIITAVPARKSPYFNQVELNAKGKVRLSKPLDSKFIRRQDAPIVYDTNASIYVWNRDALFHYPAVLNDETLLYVMSEDTAFDIDTEFDFEVVEFLMKKREKLL